jgi:hypothetical protein
MKVCVIGCGPAGLASAHAAVGLGAEVRIFAPKNRTPQRGPLILQRPIPGITNSHPDGYVRQIVIGGSILDYRYKLYQDVNINVNGNILQEGYHAWMLDKAYGELWDRYSELIEDRIVAANELQRMHFQFDLVVSTAPLMELCTMTDYHNFRYKAVSITQGSSYPDQPENTIVFNANPKVPWVRSSRIFGQRMTEWPLTNAPGDHITIQKPISSTCNCFPRVLLTGRFGKFQNETWVDSAYMDVREAILSMRHKAEWDMVR